MTSPATWDGPVLGLPRGCSTIAYQGFVVLEVFDAAPYYNDPLSSPLLSGTSYQIWLSIE